MLFLLTQNERSAVNLKMAQNLSIIEKLGRYELVFFREGYQCVVIHTFITEDLAKEFLEKLLCYIANLNDDYPKFKVITCSQIYNYNKSLESEGFSCRKI